MPGIKEIRERAEVIIAALTPMVEAQWVFRKAPAHCPLEELPITDSVSDTMRQFRVVPSTNPVIAFLDPGQQHIEEWNDLDIQVRYMEVGLGPDAHERLIDAVSTDAAQIVQGLTRLDWSVTWVGTPLIQIETKAGRSTLVRMRDPSGKPTGVWILHLLMAVLFRQS